MSGEFDFISWLRSLDKPSGFVPVPPGDDLAVLKWAGADLLLVGADQVLDGVHFDSAAHSPRQIGRKAMNRNLSDCAAMACLPAAAVATVALPRGAGLEYAKELYLGLRDAADLFDCPIVGGDTGAWNGPLALSVTLLGRSDGMQPITRRGAKPGDRLYVTGSLGGSLLGRHLSFEPRIALARRLAATGGVSAMIDLSDGLSRDLAHLCAESGVGAVIDAESVPLHADAVALSRRDHRSALEHALHDGEDYELLLSGRVNDADCREIGVITADPGVWLSSTGRRELLPAKGWEHRF